jgi:hypothetical protein
LSAQPRLPIGKDTQGNLPGWFRLLTLLDKSPISKEVGLFLWASESRLASNSNGELKPNAEVRMTKQPLADPQSPTSNRLRFVIRPSDLIRHSSFAIRISEP